MSHNAPEELKELKDVPPRPAGPAGSIGAMMEALGGAATEPFFLHMKLSETVFTRDFLQTPEL